jgi:DNA polymerase elongation subunit (family B)
MIGTPIQNSFFTLDNSKYWYLVFLYDFLFKCVDTERLHFIEGDTDSIYFAVGGDLSKGIHQGFQYIIKDRELYDKHIYDWLPNPELGKEDEKSLLKVSIENEADTMFAVCPKCYYIHGENFEKRKMKGVSCERNKHITGKSYLDCLNGDVDFVEAENMGFKTLKTAGYS